MQKITPCLWFGEKAEEAINFYIDTFNGGPHKRGSSRIIQMMYSPEGYTEGPLAGMEGTVLTCIFELDGQQFQGLDGGPVFKFNEAISLSVDCEDQEEVDYFWNKLSAVPEFEQCGWLKDKHGLSWQIVPKQLGELLNDPDKAKAKRVMDVMLEMHKLDIAGLEKAAQG